ncbi:MAG: ABC transporter substrate-binding protein [Clostridia bacterium]|nr:ABC transporter substrate-binding protein [Clostridia bacterium]
MIKKSLAVLLALAMLFALAACGENGATGSGTETTTSHIREIKTKVAALNGPTGLGLAKLAVDRAYAYDVQYYSDPQEVAPLLTTGEIDIAALPINLAANLYNKTKGGIQILAINTLGVLHVIENGNSIKSIADLKGKTVYATGQGSTPEYIINYVLEQNGLDPEKDVDIQYKAAHSELATLAVEGKADICILPEPFATKVIAQTNMVETTAASEEASQQAEATTAAEDKITLRRALDLTTEWDKVCDVQLVQGCVVARTEYINQNPEIVKEFMSFNEVSVNYLNSNGEGAGVFLIENGYFDNTSIAVSTIKNSNLVFIEGEEMKTAAKQVFEILHQANPASVGGAIPDDGIYYVAA